MDFFKILKKRETSEASDELIGSLLKGYVNFKNIRYPKQPLSQIEPGTWGIVILTCSDIIEGEIPLEMQTVKQGTYEFCAKGPLPPLEIGTNYYFEGILKDDPKGAIYGNPYVYEIHQMHKEFHLDTLEQKQQFIRAIFPTSKADLLCNHYEDPTIPLEAKDIEGLCKIKGIKYKTATTLVEIYEQNINQCDNFIKLQEYGLSANQVYKLQQKFKSTDTILHILKKNPYALMDKVEGFGWVRCDAIALNGGYDPCGKDRIAAYIKYFLTEQAENQGHTWIELPFLAENISLIARNLTDDMMKTYLREWVSDQNEQKAWLFYDTDFNRIGLMKFRKLEEQIAKELLRLQRSKCVKFSDEEIEEAIKESEESTNFEYTNEQRKAIYNVCNNNVSLIVGSSGVGKSTIMRPVVKLLQQHDFLFHQTALSGRAGSNLSEITGEEGYTIHRLLGWNPTTCKFMANRSNPLVSQCIILDELSLVGGELFLDLLKAIGNGTKLIMIGDHKQLESIGNCNLLKDIMESNVLSINLLVEIHRQAQKSGIITNSIRASAGEQIVSTQAINEVRGELKDFHVISYNEKELGQEYVVDVFKDLHYNKKISLDDIGIIVPLRKNGTLSCYNLNQKIQSIVNGLPKENDIEIKLKDGNVILREGDKIMVQQNNYDCRNEKGEKIAIFNGNLGYIVEIDSKAGEIILNLKQQGIVHLNRSDWHTIDLGYAGTCHKFQGSTIPYVIVALDTTAYVLLSKEWLYTALTRAKLQCSLVGQISACRTAVGISRVTKKQTWLRQLLQEYHNTDFGMDYSDIESYVYLTEEEKELNKLESKELDEWDLIETMENNEEDITHVKEKEDDWDEELPF